MGRDLDFLLVKKQTSLIEKAYINGWNLRGIFEFFFKRVGFMRIGVG